jgi:hypothetical protein
MLASIGSSWGSIARSRLASTIISNIPYPMGYFSTFIEGLIFGPITLKCPKDSSKLDSIPISDNLRPNLYGKCIVFRAFDDTSLEN